MTKALTALCVLTLLAALAAAGTVAPQIFAEVGSAAAPQTVTISVEALQRQVDMRTLPVTKSKTAIGATTEPERRHPRRFYPLALLHAAGL
jgi:hypothetical protein